MDAANNTRYRKAAGLPPYDNSSHQLLINKRHFLLTRHHGIVQQNATTRHHSTQGEIVNILLKIKNSFLPTKQILIGL
ncbi:hypothetical protein, partial [Citrobacter freundii]|uniref:hypothetical protein n=1 Tax=Citrobacter freundii TaxID=546 RepID=UPI003879B842